jgi:hypothetical protein
MRRILIAAVAAVAAVVAVGLIAGSAGAAKHPSKAKARAAAAAKTTNLRLTPSTPQLAACMPHARVKVTVKSTTDRVGFDRFKVRARGLPRNTDFTVFLLQTAGAPFGAAEYIGDITSNKRGNARNEFRLIVDEAFSSTIDNNGKRVRVELNRVGMWFADPADDDFCSAAPGVNGVTPFDGDNEAGVQAFNSANTRSLPAP